MVTIAAMADFIDISGLLYPKSVAVIGTAGRAGNLGGDTVQQLIRFGFPGPVWAVNPDAALVCGVPCFPSVADLPESPDLAILAVPAHAVAEAIRACAARGTRNGLALAGDFAGAGDAGAALQDEVVAVCRDTGFVLCGPNSAGLINAAAPIAAGFATALPDVAALRAGPISVVTQSGGIGITVLSLVQQAGFGCRHLISSGNEAVVGFADYLHALAHDASTRVIAAYLERMNDGERLMRALEATRAQGRRAVMIKPGAPAATATGEDHAFDAILQELGVIRVNSVEALVDTCLLLASTPMATLPGGPGIGIATVGGGNGILAADQCAGHGLAVPALASISAERLRQLDPAVSAANPIDLTPADTLARLPATMDLLAAQPDIDALLLVVGPLGVPVDEMTDMVTGVMHDCAKPACIAWSPPPGVVERLAAAGIACFAEPDRALRALSHVVAAMSRPRRDGVPVTKFAWDVHVEPGARVVTDDRCHAILIDAGLPVAPGRLAVDAAAALPIAHEVGLPVTLKGVGPHVTPRGAADLLATDLRNADEVLAAFRRLEDRARAQEITLDGIYVQQMQREGAELLVSVFRTASFGTMVSCGAAGRLRELLGEVVTARAPVSEPMAAEMIGRLRYRAMAQDASGPLDVAAPAAFLARLSQLGAGAPWPAFNFEVNPVRWTRGGVVAVHSLLTIGGTPIK